MLTATDIEAIANDITDIYGTVEKECIKSIVDHITAGKRITQASVWQMKKLNDVGYLRRDLVSAVRKQTNLAFNDVETLIKEALNRSVGVDISKVADSIRAGNFKDNFGSIPKFKEHVRNSEQFRRILNSTIASVKDAMNLTGTKAVQASVKAYADAINRAYLEMATGNYTYEQAVERAVGAIGKSGIKIVDSKEKATSGQMVGSGRNIYTTYTDKSGNIRVYPLDSAIRRDLTTTINQACGKLTVDSCSDLGTDLVETSWHIGARPEHELWQGRIFSLNPKDTRYPYFYAPQEAGGTGYGDMLGLCGINCYHSFNPYFDGSPRSTDENKPSKTENDKAYREQEQQRAYERTLRSLKREQMAYLEGGFTDKAQETQRQINALSARYHKFLNNTGRTRVSMLDKVSGYKRISTKAGATIPQPTSLTQPMVRQRTTQAKHVAPTPQQLFDKAKKIDFADPINQTGGEPYRINLDAHDYHSKTNFDENKWASLTREQRRAVNAYTGSDYEEMNRALWSDDLDRYGPYVKQEIIDCKEALDQFEVAEDIICYRGACSYEQFAKQFGMVADDLRSQINRDKIIGQVWQEKGFTSLAVNRTSAWSKNVKLEICVPKGTKGLYVSAKGKAVSHFGEGERELLINPSKMQILGSYYDRYGQLWFKACIISQP